MCRLMVGARTQPTAERADAEMKRRDAVNRARALHYADAACLKRWEEKAGGAAGLVAGHEAAKLEAAVCAAQSA